MARPPSIPESLHPAILERFAEGGAASHTRPIAEWLAREHGVEVTHVTVSRLINRLVTQRQKITDQVIAVKVGAHVVSDLDLLAHEQTRLKAVFDRLYEVMVDDDGNPRDGLTDTIGKTPTAAVFARVAGQLESVTARKLALSGAGGQGGNAPGSRGPMTSIPPESED